MRKIKDFGRLVSVFASAVVLTAGSALWGTAQAQIGQFGGPTGPNLQGTHAPPIETESNINLREQLRQQAEHALIFDDWLIFPTAFAGAIYDTNPTQTSTGAKAAAGARLAISGLAERDEGVSKTDLYGMADGRFYTTGSSSASDIATAQLGGIETYSPLPDLRLLGQADFTRQRDLFDTFGVNHSVTTLNTTGVGLAPTNNPSTYNQLTAAGTSEKTFGHAFVDLGGSVVDQLYDKTTAGGAPNNIVYTATTRGGYWITPDIYGFAEGSGDSRNFSGVGLNSNGYRILTGVGTGRIGLIQGEVYIGWQEEFFASAAIGTASGPAFGGQVDYSPAPELYLKVGVDRSIGAAQLTATAGTSTTVTDLLGAATYALNPAWSVSGRAGLIRTEFKGINRTDNSWTIGPTLTYSVWQNFGLTFDYQHIETASNAALVSFGRDVVSIGVSYKY